KSGCLRENLFTVMRNDLIVQKKSKYYFDKYFTTQLINVVTRGLLNHEHEINTVLKRGPLFRKDGYAFQVKRHRYRSNQSLDPQGCPGRRRFSTRKEGTGSRPHINWGSRTSG